MINSVMNDLEIKMKTLCITQEQEIWTWKFSLITLDNGLNLNTNNMGSFLHSNVSENTIGINLLFSPSQ